MKVEDLHRLLVIQPFPADRISLILFRGTRARQGVTGWETSFAGKDRAGKQ